MSSDLFRELDAVATSTPAQAGSMVFQHGGLGSAVYTVRTGKIALRWEGLDRVYPMEVLRPGSVIGLPAALNGEYSATARAVEDSELGLVPSAIVLDMLDCNPSLMQAAMTHLASEVARMRSLITEKVSKQPLRAKGGRVIRWPF